jgi:hypothetical protein
MLRFIKGTTSDTYESAMVKKGSPSAALGQIRTDAVRGTHQLPI